jgi:hypothetical protein
MWYRLPETALISPTICREISNRGAVRRPGEADLAVRLAHGKRYVAAFRIGDDELSGAQRALQEQKPMQLRGGKRAPQRKVVQKRRARRLDAFIPAQDGNDGGSAFPIRAVDSGRSD